MSNSRVNDMIKSYRDLKGDSSSGERSERETNPRNKYTRVGYYEGEGVEMWVPVKSSTQFW